MTKRILYIVAAGIGSFAIATASAYAQPDGVLDNGLHRCHPVRSDTDPLLSLQRLLDTSCRALTGEQTASPESLASKWRVQLGGWTDGSFRDNDFAGRDTTVTLDHVNLHLDVRYQEQLQFFVETGYEVGHDVTGLNDGRSFELEQVFLRYTQSDAFQGRIGRFSTPFGYWTPVHWAINVDTIEEPIHEAGRVIPEQQFGGDLFGHLFPEGHYALEPEIEYSLYFGYGGLQIDTEEVEGVSVGGDLRLRVRGRHFLGVSYYTQKNSLFQDRREHNVMLYTEIALPFDLLARAEYLNQWRDARLGFAKSVSIFYAKLRWDFYRRAYLNYRYNAGGDDRFGTTVEHKIHTITLGVRPVPRILLKLETNFHDLNRGIQSYVSWGASFGLIF